MCRSWNSHEPPSPISSQYVVKSFGYENPYHFEGIKLFFDLLSKHWGESVTSCNFTPAIVLLARPGIMKLYPWAERGISFGSP